MHACMHTYIHTYMFRLHIFRRACVYMHIHVCIHTYMPVCALINYDMGS